MPRRGRAFRKKIGSFLQACHTRRSTLLGRPIVQPACLSSQHFGDAYKKPPDVFLLVSSRQQSHQHTMATPSSDRFTGLPAEIRLNVYDHLVQDPQHQKHSSCWSTTNLLATNHQIFAELMPILYANFVLNIQDFRIPPYATIHIRKSYIIIDWEVFWPNVSKFKICMWYLVRYCPKLQTIRIRIKPGFVNSPSLRTLWLGVPREVVASSKLEEIIVESFTDPFPWRALPGTYREGRSDWLRHDMVQTLRAAAAQAGLQRVTVIERLLGFWIADGDSQASDDDESGDLADTQGTRVEQHKPQSRSGAPLVGGGEVVDLSDDEDGEKKRPLRYFEALAVERK